MTDTTKIAEDFLLDNFWHIAVAAKTISRDDFIETHHTVIKQYLSDLGVALTEQHCRVVAGEVWSRIRGH